MVQYFNFGHWLEATRSIIHQRTKEYLDPRIESKTVSEASYIGRNCKLLNVI